MARLIPFAMIVLSAVAGLGCGPGAQSEAPAQAPAEPPAAPAAAPPAAAAPAAAAPSPTATTPKPEGEHEHGEHPIMMQAASDACSGKAAGADCSFKGEKGDIKGKCAEGRENHLMCRGEGEGEHKGKMMDEAKSKEACASLAEGKSCSFQGPEGAVTGTCRKGHQADELLCLPAGEHRGGEHRGGDGEKKAP